LHTDGSEEVIVSRGRL